MSDGYCSLYLQRSHADFDLKELESVMSRIEASLYFPETEDVIDLTREGEQQRYLRADFERKLRSSELTSFQWWFSDCEDIYCRLRWAGGGCVLEFGLDGLDRSQVSQFVGCVEGYAKELADVGILIGLLVDADARSEQYDWDKFFLTGTALDKAIPTLLAVPIERIADIPPTYKRFEQHGNLLLFFGTTDEALI